MKKFIFVLVTLGLVACNSIPESDPNPTQNSLEIKGEHVVPATSAVPASDLASVDQKPEDDLPLAVLPPEMATEVFFNFNSPALDNEAKRTLRNVAGMMTVYPDLSVEVNGYADRIGSAAYNLKLSELRAKEVEDFLVQNGVEKNRISATGHGKATPGTACPGMHKAALIKCLQPDRHVTIQSH